MVAMCLLGVAIAETELAAAAAGDGCHPLPSATASVQCWLKLCCFTELCCSDKNNCAGSNMTARDNCDPHNLVTDRLPTCSKEATSTHNKA